jgi:hypothetical protein
MEEICGEISIQDTLKYNWITFLLFFYIVIDEIWLLFF